MLSRRWTGARKQARSQESTHRPAPPRVAAVEGGRRDIGSLVVDGAVQRRWPLRRVVALAVSFSIALAASLAASLSCSLAALLAISALAAHVHVRVPTRPAAVGLFVARRCWWSHPCSRRAKDRSERRAGAAAVLSERPPRLSYGHEPVQAWRQLGTVSEARDRLARPHCAGSLGGKLLKLRVWIARDVPSHQRCCALCCLCKRLQGLLVQPRRERPCSARSLTVT